MEAVEFEAFSDNGIIRIPEKYQKMANAKLKIILLRDEIEKGMEKKAKIKELIKEIKKNHIFEEIKNPEKWQEELRNEWK